ncbi:hypothetical protein BASA50_005839 [Batrachochytrium salamandrivorans]|uniref:Uncharacterized protein n=1 Tax=Batrachochytrium salamandrivorans TaxID=1357716 RepID=A0ABQ8FBM1_9FUNG|nr:hypothetical protein BASA50_005839 [Batrachochytrium salamandrivorans]
MFASYATLYRYALVRHDERNFQSFIDIFRADLAPPVVHSVQNSNNFRNVNAFLAATKWGSENLDNLAYPASIIVKAIMVYFDCSPLRFISLAAHKSTRDTNCKITNGVSFHIMQRGHARRGLPIENGGDSVFNGVAWLFVLEPELQAKPSSIDQHLAAVDAKIEALNLAKSK